MISRMAQVGFNNRWLRSMSPSAFRQHRPTHGEVGWRMGVRMDARALALGRKPPAPEAYKGSSMGT